MSKDILAGIHAVESALKYYSDNVSEVMYADDTRNPRVKQLLEDAKERGVRIHARPMQALDKLTQGERHQGVVGFYSAPDALSDADLPRLIEAAGSTALFLILDEITDPHNFGACLRSALAASVTAVIVPKDRAAPTNATSTRAINTRGALIAAVPEATHHHPESRTRHADSS